MGARFERKLMAHYINTVFNPTSGTSYELLGEDLAEYSVEMNPIISVERNVLDQDVVYHDGYEPTASVTPYYAREGSGLFSALQSVVDHSYHGNKCKTYIVEVHLWDKVGTNLYRAVRRTAYVGIDSFGGDTSGYQIPFTLTIQTSGQTTGNFNVSTNTFSAENW